MAAARLYPTLGSFYRNTYIDFGSEADMMKCVSEEKLYRKPLKDDNAANKLTGREQEKKIKSKDIKEKKMKLNNLEAGQVRSSEAGQVRSSEAGHVRSSEAGQVRSSEAGQVRSSEAGQVRSSESGQVRSSEDQAEDSLEEISRLISMDQPNDSSPAAPCLPSAPPLEWSDDAIQRFLDDALAQQELTQDAPTIDYSTLAMPDDIPFDEAWIDDLVPDYDTSVDDENDSGVFNNLNKEQSKELRKKSLLIKNIIEIRETPSQRRSKPQRAEVPVSSQHHHRSHKHRRENNQEKVDTDAPATRSPQVSRLAPERPPQELRHVQGGKQDLVGLERGSAENLAAKPSSPSSAEYNAWMTWRKQVNRQLATVILLRRNGQVHIQKSDMSRKPLKQSSIDFVSQFAKSDSPATPGGKTPLMGKTSLGGKPYVMYGIPRVSLPANQKEV